MSHANYYLLERMAQQRHQELLDEAERERMARQVAGNSQSSRRDHASVSRPLRQLAYLILVAILTLFVAAQVADAAVAVPDAGAIAYLALL